MIPITCPKCKTDDVTICKCSAVLKIGHKVPMNDIGAIKELDDGFYRLVGTKR